MSFRRMEYFLAVAKHLNFTKAAREKEREAAQQLGL